MSPEAFLRLCRGTGEPTVQVSPRDSRRVACCDSTRSATRLLVPILLLAPVVDLAAVTIGRYTALHTQQVSGSPPVRRAPRPRCRRGDGGEVRIGSSPMVEKSSPGSYSGYPTVGQEPSGANAAVATAWGDAERLGPARPRGFAPLTAEIGTSSARATGSRPAPCSIHPASEVVTDTTTLGADSGVPDLNARGQLTCDWINLTIGKILDTKYRFEA